MSLAAELRNAHKSRLAAIAAKAAEHKASKKPALIAELKECCAPKPEPIPEPEPEPKSVEEVWVEQQIAKHKPLWFSVVRSGGPPIKDIQRATCGVYGVALNDLLSARRTANLVMPRQVAIYLAKELTSLSWKRIGSATGGRDHSTAIHGHSKIAHRLKSDERLAERIAEIKRRLA